MSLLYWFEGIRMPGLNEFMLAITTLGEETAFLVLALIVFWCVDKRRGYFLMSVGFAGTILNQFLKLWFRIPRPWVLDENFTILEAAREAATGYSFPSGHTTSAVGTFGSLAASEKRSWLRWAFIAVAALVGISRMYVGVHTPKDVLVGALTSIVLIFAFRKITLQDHLIGMKVLVAGMIAMSLGLMLFVTQYPFPADVDPHNLESGVKNACTMLGCLVGVAVVYVGEKRFVRFETGAIWWAQILKAVLGLAVVLLVKEGLRAPLEVFLPVYPARAVRYFLIVITAGILWPMTFRFFGKLGTKKEKLY
jgi:undecaprenyl-diphosphatase